MPIVDVAGLGRVSFPDDMDEQAIREALDLRFRTTPQETLARSAAATGAMAATIPEAVMPQAVSGQVDLPQMQIDRQNLLPEKQMVRPDLQGSESMWAHVPAEVMRLNRTDEEIEQDRQMAEARKEAQRNPELHQSRIEQLQAIYRARMATLPNDYKKANELGAALYDWYKKAMAKEGVAVVDPFAGPKGAPPMTEEEAESLIGKGPLAKSLAAAQQNIQGIAEGFMQPENILMAPGAATLERALAGRAAAARFAKAGKLLPGAELGKGIGHTYLAPMAVSTVEQGLETGAAAWDAAFGKGSWEDAIRPAVGMTTTGLMIGYPARAAFKKAQGKIQAAREAVTTESLKTELNQVLESLDALEKEPGPGMPELLRRQEYLQRRLSQREETERQTMELARKKGWHTEGEGGNKTVITDTDLGPGRIAVYDKKTGSMIINRDNLHRTVEIDAGGNAKKAGKILESLVNQEAIHSYIENADAERYWRTLTPLERGLEEHLYPHPEGTPDYIKGQEALRRRMEVANGMTPLEFLAYYTRQRWSARGVDMLGRIMGGIREKIATSKEEKGPIKEQLDIVDRTQRNLNRARERLANALEPQTTQVLRPMREPSGKGTEQVPGAEGRKTYDKGGGQKGLAPATQVSLEKVSPAVQAQGTPLAPPTAGMAKPGVAAPGAAAISKTPTTVEQKQASPREEAIAAINRKEEIATKVGGEYRATRRQPDGKLVDLYEVGGALIRVPADSPIEAVRAKMKEVEDRFTEGPFATRRQTGLPPDFDNVRMIMAIPADRFKETYEKQGLNHADMREGVARYITNPERRAEVVQANAELAKQSVKLMEQLANPNADQNLIINRMQNLANKKQVFTEALRVDDATYDVAGGMSIADAAKKHGLDPRSIENVVQRPAATRRPTAEPREGEDIEDFGRRVDLKRVIRLRDEYHQEAGTGSLQRYLDSEAEAFKQSHPEFRNTAKGSFGGKLQDDLLYAIVADADNWEGSPKPEREFAKKLLAAVRKENPELIDLISEIQKRGTERYTYAQDAEKFPDQLAEHRYAWAYKRLLDVGIESERAKEILDDWKNEWTDVAERDPELAITINDLLHKNAIKERGLDWEEEPAPEEVPEPESLAGRPFHPEGEGQQMLDLPSARRPGYKPTQKEKGQQLFEMTSSWVMPGEEKTDIRGRPIEREAGVAPPPGTPPDLPPAVRLLNKVREMVNSDVTFGTRPSRRFEGRKERTVNMFKFKDVETWARNNGIRVSREGLVDMFTGEVWEDLLNATPERLGQFVKAYRLDKVLGIRFDKEGRPINIPQAPWGGFSLIQEVEGQKKPPEARTVYRAGKKITGPAERRAQIVQAVAEERLKEVAPQASLNRKELEINDINFKDARKDAYVELDPSVTRSAFTLFPILKTGARAKNAPITQTHAVVALLDFNTVVNVKLPNGKTQKTHPVEVVSTYNDHGKQMIADPVAVGVMGKPSRELNSAFLRRYKPIAKILLTNPVQNFRKRFATLQEFNEKIGKEAVERSKASEFPYAGEGPGEVKSDAELLRDEQLIAWEERRGETAREEEGNLVLPPGPITPAEWRALQVQAAGGVAGGTPGLRGEGGGMTGSHANEMRLLEGVAKGTIDLSRVEPLKRNEAIVLLDWLMDEVGDVTSFSDVTAAFRSLKDLANQKLNKKQQLVLKKVADWQNRLDDINETFGPLTPELVARLKKEGKWNPPTAQELASLPSFTFNGTHRVVISALQKIAEGIKREWDKEFGESALTEKQAVAKALEEIYDTINWVGHYANAARTGKTFRTQTTGSYFHNLFASQLVGKFGERPERPIHLAPWKQATLAERFPGGIQRELTTPQRWVIKGGRLIKTSGRTLFHAEGGLTTGSKLERAQLPPEMLSAAERAALAERPVIDPETGKPIEYPVKAPMFTSRAKLPKGQVGGEKFGEFAKKLETGERVIPGGALRGQPRSFSWEGEKGKLPLSKEMEEAKRFEEPVSRRGKRKPEVVDPNQIQMELGKVEGAAPERTVELPRRSFEKGQQLGMDFNDLPAAKRQRTDRAIVEYDRVRAQIAAGFNRRTVLKDIPRTLDGLESIGVVEQSDARNNIVEKSVKPIDQYLGGKKIDPQSARAYKARRAQEADGKKVRSAVIAVISSADPDGSVRTAQIVKQRKFAFAYAKRNGIEPTTLNVDKIIQTPEFQAKYPKLFETLQPNLKNLPKLFQFAQRAMEKASNMMKTSDPRQKWVAYRWLNGAKRLYEGLEYARDNWDNPQLQETARATREELASQLEKERAGGLNTQEWQHYIPGLYEGETYNDSLLTFSSMRIRGRNFRDAKSYRNYYEAIADAPNIPASYDVANIVAHRVRRGNYVLARREWLEGLKGMIDPTTKQKIALEPVPVEGKEIAYDPETGLKKVDPDTGEQVYRSFTRWHTPKPGYDLVYPHRGGKPIAILNGYESMVTSVLSESQIRKYPIGRAALHAMAALKHGWVLMLDSFHLGRLAQYATAATPNFYKGAYWFATGRKFKPPPGFGVNYRGGYSALSYRPENMAAAVKKGLISKKQMDWANELIKVNIGKGRVMQMSRHQLVREMVRNGLNAGRVSDAIYKDAVKNIPVAGWLYSKGPMQYNRWLFDHFVPGLIAETAVRTFEERNARYPNIPVHALMKDIIRDVNVTYGNMGRQGFWRDATMRDVLQLFFLAPMWREGLFQKELRYMARLPAVAEYGGRHLLNKMGMNVDPTKNYMQRITGREGLPPMGMLGTMMTKGAISYFILAQAINYITRGQPTWKNEEGRKLDAWLPFGRDGIWLPTLGVFGEITGHLLRLAETKPTTWDAALQIGIDSMGPPARMLNVWLTGKTPRGRKLTSSLSRLGAGLEEEFPAPISLGTLMRGTGHRIAPGHIAPNEPGQIPQRLFGTLGFKVYRDTDAQAKIKQKVREWRRKEGYAEPPMEMTPREVDSLASLRHALIINDHGGAVRIYNNLIENYRKDPARDANNEIIAPETRIENAMKLWLERPWTGSKEKEAWFRTTLNSADQALYERAEYERFAEYNAFLDFLVKQPISAP